jgi:hypothetical protein
MQNSARTLTRQTHAATTYCINYKRTAPMTKVSRWEVVQNCLRRPRPAWHLACVCHFVVPVLFIHSFRFAGFAWVASFLLLCTDFSSSSKLLNSALTASHRCTAPQLCALLSNPLVMKLSLL